MSEQDEFLLRWMRLKRASAEAADTPNSLEPVALDPASLPAIETITAESDIGVFLQAGVPEDLLRAALRSAWMTDPKIRNFIGTAESQWDFNDPNAMPGFGELSEVVSAHSVVSHSVADLDREMPTAAPMKTTEPHRLGQPDKVWLSAGMQNGQNQSSQITPEPPTSIETLSDSRSLPRLHGSALPKFT
jgi:hypothetical protein